jgi:hypothetical protein
MKPGSKAWVRMMRKVYFFSMSLGVLGLTAKFYIWQNPHVEFYWLSLFFKVSTIWATTVYCIFNFLESFAPLKKDYDWTLVYPELALGHSEESESEKQ